MGGTEALTPEGWTCLTRRFAAVPLVLAAANVLVRRNVSTDVRVAQDTLVMPAAFFGYLALTIRRARRVRSRSEGDRTSET